MSTLRCANNLLAICAKDLIAVYENLLEDSSLKHLRTIDVVPFCFQLKADKNIEEEEPEEAECENNPQNNTGLQIIDSRFSQCGNLFAVVTSTKHLIIFNVLENWRVNGSVINLPKAPTAVHFDLKNNVIVSDRSGSICKYPDSQDLLGHVSMVLDFCLAKNDSLILTVDRDEKLRISRYPESFVIENFCLGHTSFINSVVLLSDNFAATAGGDSVIRLWDIINGNCVFATLPICDSPIRRLCVCVSAKEACTKLIALPEDCGSLRVFGYNPETQTLNDESERKSETADSFFDVIFNEKNSLILALGRKGIHCGDLEKGFVLKLVEFSSHCLLENLQQSSDCFPLNKLYKVIGFDNMKNYNERKLEKISRKRKVCSESSNT